MARALASPKATISALTHSSGMTMPTASTMTAAALLQIQGETAALSSGLRCPVMA